MPSCQKCGIEVPIGASFLCGSCRTAVRSSTHAGKDHRQQSVARAEIPESWITTFDLIEKAGGPKFPKGRDLSLRERCKVVSNGWGFFLGPIYYLIKGMWKRAIVLFALCVAVSVILGILLEAMGIRVSESTNLIVPAVFSTRANIDYYKKMVLGDNGWW